MKTAKTVTAEMLQGVLGAWTPIADQVLVRPLEAIDRSAGGIITPEAHRERPTHGVVIAAGPGVTHPTGLVPIAVKPGELVAFGKYAGMEFPVNNVPCYLLRDLECLARKPAGTFLLVQHEDTDTGKVTFHEAHEVCDDCQRAQADAAAKAAGLELMAKAGDA